jgi:hypothetical protein
MNSVLLFEQNVIITREKSVLISCFTSNEKDATSRSVHKLILIARSTKKAIKSTTFGIELALSAQILVVSQKKK